MAERLATAQWENPADVPERYPFADGKFWLGRAEDASAIGYGDDRHICLVSGTRGGKGTSVIVNNLCFWPGSAVVVDPKGENATVTAARRGQGSEHCAGMGQAVHVLDPFNAAQVDERYRSCFNPLADLDPQREETIDEASRLANAIVVVKDDSRDPIWDESARTMVRGLILHVLTAKEFTDDERNLITVRNLISRGEWRVAEAIRELGHSDDKIDPPHLLLWRAMEVNPAFDGIVAGIGSRFRSMMVTAPKTFEGVLQAAAQHTEFLDSPGIRRVLAKSDFKLAELKTKPEGMTLYLSLPQRYMDTHYRWLRMMVVLTCTEMEITRGQPATGHPVLIVLDEFAGLKRMTAIENAVAQLAGFGVKLFFVLQSLEQLKSTYKDAWETFLANATKIFFSIEDHFTREYVSKLAGETEIVRELHSTSESRSESESRAEGTSESRTRSQSTTKGTSTSQTKGASRSVNQSQSEGVNRSRNASQTAGVNQTQGWSTGDSLNETGRPLRVKETKDEIRYKFGGSFLTFTQPSYSRGWNWSRSGSQGTNRSTTEGTSEGTSSSTSRGFTDGISSSDTRGLSQSETSGTSETTGTSRTTTHGTSNTAGSGRSESIHKRPLVTPDEVGRQFARIDDRDHPFYPGLALVIVTGAAPMIVKRVHYFDDPQFIECFSPHPDHEWRAATHCPVDGIQPLIATLEAAMNGRQLTIARWLIESGNLALPGQPAAIIEHVPPDDRAVQILVPRTGKVSATSAQNQLASGEYPIPDGPLFEIKSYEPDTGIDPLQELREACAALKKPKLAGLKLPKFSFGPGWLSFPKIPLLIFAVILATGPLWWPGSGVALLLAFIAWSVAAIRADGFGRTFIKWVLFGAAFLIGGEMVAAINPGKPYPVLGGSLAGLILTASRLPEWLAGKASAARRRFQPFARKG